MLSRRDFVVRTAVGGAALLLGFRIHHSPAGPLWVRIDPDGTVTILSAKTEMGQGVWTALPMIVAEELDADWSLVRVEHAPVDPPYDRFDTGGSSSVRRSWPELRQAGAVTRAMLVQAAADQWGVAPEACETEPSVVVHRASGRRAGYGILAAAAMRVPKPDPARVPLKDPSRFRLVGRPMARLDLEAKVTGAARYAMDVQLPGMLIANVARCPNLGGSLKRVDDTRAKATPGVRAVVPLEAIAERAQLPARVAVVADSTWSAMQGRRALTVDWNPGPQGTFSTAEFSRRCLAAVDTPGRVVLNQGDVDAARAHAAHVVEATYEVPFLAHANMEPMGCVADVRGDRAELWAPTQSPNELIHAVAAALGIQPEAVTVHVLFAGGGFGRRWYADYAVDAAQISRAAGAPVKVVWSREEDIQHDFYRPHRVIRLRAALDEHAMVTAWETRMVGASWRAFWDPKTTEPEGDEWQAGQLAYAIPNVRMDYVYLPAPVPIGAWRAVSHNEHTFAIESFMDELAHAAGVDPIEFRLRHLSDNPRLRHVLELVAPEARGHGVACMRYGTTYVAQVADVDAHASDVRVRRMTCAFDCGQVINPDGLRAQIEGSIAWAAGATLFGEITVTDGRIVQSNFSDYRVLRMREMPEVQVRLVDSHEAPGGAGEPAVPCVAPAIANALYAATGRRARRLPVNGARSA